MKKTFSLITVMLILLCLAGCSMDFEPVGEPKVMQAMQYLAQGDIPAASEMMHPDAVAAAEDLDGSLQQLATYLGGRTVTDSQRLSVNVTNNFNTSGTNKQEKGVFQLTLSDGSQLKVDYAYLTSAAGEGFTTFYLHFPLPEQPTA